jgi:uncharacterized membrane protein YoaK (UPF0700 family)
MTISPSSPGGPPGRAPDADQLRRLMDVLLTVATGCLDAVSFLSLGRVFASVMTGNLVLLGIGFAERRGNLALHAGVALASYGAGVAGGARIGGRPDEHEAAWPRPVSAALVVELALLAGALAGWELAAAAPSGAAQLALLAAVTAAMGIQSSAVNRLRSGVSTTYLTSAFVQLATSLVVGPRDQIAVRGSAVLAMVAGAAAGAGLLAVAPRLAPAPAVVLLAGVVVIAALFRSRLSAPV